LPKKTYQNSTKLYTILSDLKPTLALSSCGWLSLWLHHKIEKKKKNGKFGAILELERKKQKKYKNWKGKRKKKRNFCHFFGTEEMIVRVGVGQRRGGEGGFFFFFFFFFNFLMELGWQEAPLCGFRLNWQLYFKELLQC